MIVRVNYIRRKMKRWEASWKMDRESIKFEKMPMYSNEMKEMKSVNNGKMTLHE